MWMNANKPAVVVHKKLQAQCQRQSLCVFLQFLSLLMHGARKGPLFFQQQHHHFQRDRMSAASLDLNENIFV